MNSVNGHLMSQTIWESIIFQHVVEMLVLLTGHSHLLILMDKRFLNFSPQKKFPFKILT